MGSPVVFVAVPRSHSSATEDGALWMWGDSHVGCLGRGDTQPRIRPTQLAAQMSRSCRGYRYISHRSNDGPMDEAYVSRECPQSVGDKLAAEGVIGKVALG